MNSKKVAGMTRQQCVVRAVNTAMSNGLPASYAREWQQWFNSTPADGEGADEVSKAKAPIAEAKFTAEDLKSVACAALMMASERLDNRYGFTPDAHIKPGVFSVILGGTLFDVKRPGAVIGLLGKRK